MNTKRQRHVVLAIALLSVAILWLLLWTAGDLGRTAEGFVASPGDSSFRRAEDEPVAPVDAPMRREPGSHGPVLDLRLNVDTLARLEDGGGPAAALLREMGRDEALTGGEIQLLDLLGRPVSSGAVRFVEGPSTGRAFHADEHGLVKVTGVVSGKHLIEVSGPSTFRRFLRLVHPEDRITIIRWRPSTSVYGSVSDEENRSLPGVAVTASGRSVTTDEGGQYRIEGLIPGEGTPLCVRAKGFVTTEVSVELQSGMPLRYHFVLPRAATIAGRVLLPAGEEKDARLYLMPVSMGRTSRELTFPFHLRGVHAEVPIGADGSFEIDGLPAPAAMQVVLRHPRFTMTPVPFTIRNPGPQREKLILAPNQAPLVTGQVRAVAHEQEPGRGPRRPREGIEGATVEVRPERNRSGGSRSRLVPISPDTLAAHVVPLEVIDLEWAETRTDAKGNYSLPRRQGREPMVLTASAPAYLPTSVRIAGGGTFRKDLELVPISGDGVGTDAPSLRLTFVTTETPPPMLRITLSRDDVQESTPFLWSSSEPYVLRFPVPSRVHVAATFQDAGRFLSRFETEVVVRGEVAHAITVPAR